MYNLEFIKTILKENSANINIKYIDNRFLQSIDRVILSSYRVGLSDDVVNIFIKFLPMKDNAPDGMKHEVFSAMRQFISEKKDRNEPLNALILLRFLITKTNLCSTDYYDIAECLWKLNAKKLSKYFLNIYKNIEEEGKSKYLSLGNFYNLTSKEYKKAILNYQKFLEYDDEKAIIYIMIGNLYRKIYKNRNLKKQIYYFSKAFELSPKDRLILHSLAFAYEKLEDKQNADKFYKLLLENKPTETDYYNYGCFLINNGDFKNGHKYFTRRFYTDDINLKYPAYLDENTKWDFASNIKDKILLVHYEQGFGDTFMYCRFLPYLTKLANKVIFIVQKELQELLRQATILSDIEIVANYVDINSLMFDTHISLLDVPNVLDIDANKIPYNEKYIEILDEQVDKYKERYIRKTNNLRVGLAYSGKKDANYNSRNIDFHYFNELLNMKNVDFYSFNEEYEKDKRVVNLYKTFNNFTDTACAIKSMDVIISTDNVILNLAGAMGVKTIGLFNKIPNFRWFSLSGNDIGWYKSVMPLKVKQENHWKELIYPRVIDIVEKLTCS